VSSATSFTLSYPAATVDNGTLTHRIHLDDPPVMIPASGWEYTNASKTAIRLLPNPTNFVANDIYEFTYTAKDPTVNGLGFAAVRDWNAWLRYETEDDDGNPNPLAGDITRIYTEISSQPGRLLNDFGTRLQSAENGLKVFDGMMQWISAGSGLNLNFRFSQPNRTERNRRDRFKSKTGSANVMTTDPFTSKTDSRYARGNHRLPLAAEITRPMNTG
jgi:hypothetical protein